MSDEDSLTSSAAIAVLVSQFEYLRGDVQEIQRYIRESDENKVSHREWSQRNEHVNSRLSALGREIGDLRTEIRAKSAPWWSVAAVITAAAGFAWSVLKPGG